MTISFSIPFNSFPFLFYLSSFSIYELSDFSDTSKSFRKSSPSQEDDTSFDRLNNDMKGHDFIDNIMYIYYGPNGTLRRDIGGNVIVIGAVFALAPQILTIIIAFLRNK